MNSPLLNFPLINFKVKVIPIICLTAILAGFAASLTPTPRSTAAASRDGDGKRRRTLDPAGWGSDHVGKPQPDFVSGDECLFCHRLDVGPTWTKNRHHLTIRPAANDPVALAALKTSASTRDFFDEVDFVMGAKNRTRYLKRTKQYGQLALLTTAWKPADDPHPPTLIDSRNPRWDAKAFGSSCAGCHTTAVDPKTQSFSAVSLDCFTCHGDVPLEHSKDTLQVILSKRRKDPARVVVSICGQCHIRTGKSRSSGFPYANNFVAGDNLFRDLKVDWSDKHLNALNPADRHVLENVRDVVVNGKTQVTCLSCHEVHSQSSKKHEQLDEGGICANCHKPGDHAVRRKYKVHSRVCGY